MSDLNELNSGEFLRGQSDCKKGAAHKTGQTESYNRGYATQYEMEAALSQKGFN